MSGRFRISCVVLNVLSAAAALSLLSLVARAAPVQQRPTLQRGESHRSPKPESPRAFVTQDLTQGLTPTDLVQSLVGTGVTISNVTFTGASVSAGRFSGGLGVVGFDSGIVLGSGAIVDIVGPNGLDDTSTSHDLPGDPELDALVPGYTTHDAVLLEFDFTCPSTTSISFGFVFASEEYNEYVDSTFNDVFGFFLNGQNIALVPATVTPVAINNVNCGNPYTPPGGANCSFFINNDCSDIGAGTFPCAQVDTEMDGLTQIFLASSSINPGVNHIKLALADAGDWVLDSNVFLEATSLNCQSFPPPLTYCTAGTTSNGCSPAITSLGVPSASESHGFFVGASQVRNRKPGLLIYGLTGRDATPFYGGVLCVHPPLKRTPITFAGGNALPADDCSGTFSLDMNAFASGLGGGHPDPALALAGVVVDCQWWSRDPTETCLSNALEYVIEP